MSINFTAKVVVTETYYTGIDPIVSELATMDLGCARALREVCTRDCNGDLEDSGTVSLTTRQAYQWLWDAFIGQPNRPVHAKAAAEYISVIDDRLISTPEHKVEVIVTWG